MVSRAVPGRGPRHRDVLTSEGAASQEGQELLNTALCSPQGVGPSARPRARSETGVLRAVSLGQQPKGRLAPCLGCRQQAEWAEAVLSESPGELPGTCWLGEPGHGPEAASRQLCSVEPRVLSTPILLCFPLRVSGLLLSHQSTPRSRVRRLRRAPLTPLGGHLWVLGMEVLTGAVRTPGLLGDRQAPPGPGQCACCQLDR